MIVINRIYMVSNEARVKPDEPFAGASSRIMMLVRSSFNVKS